MRQAVSIWWLSYGRVRELLLCSSTENTDLAFPLTREWGCCVCQSERWLWIVNVFLSGQTVNKIPLKLRSGRAFVESLQLLLGSGRLTASSLDSFVTWKHVSADPKNFSHHEPVPVVDRVNHVQLTSRRSRGCCQDRDLLAVASHAWDHF